MRSSSLLVLLLIASPVAAQDAAATFKSNCAMCHGSDGGGQTPVGKSLKVRDLGSPEVQKMKDEELETIIADGKGKMPAYKAKLDAAAIKGLVKFIRELGIKK